MGRHEKSSLSNMNDFNSAQEKINQISRSRSIKNILFVCLGNLCRSPMAEYLLRDHLEKSGNSTIKITSCGFLDQTGTPVPKEIYGLMNEAGIDISGHQSSPITWTRVRESDLIIVMEIKQKEELTHQYLEDAHRIFLLSQFDKQNPEERNITDPMGKPPSLYRICFNEIKFFVEGLASHI